MFKLDTVVEDLQEECNNMDYLPLYPNTTYKLRSVCFHYMYVLAFPRTFIQCGYILGATYLKRPMYFKKDIFHKTAKMKDSPNEINQIIVF